MKSLLGLAMGFICGPALASTVYVQSNQPSGNNLLTYTMSADGGLAPHPSVETGGKGFMDASLTLGPYDSDQEIITNAEHTLLFTVNGGSNSISVFRISSNGQLTAVAGSPFASHGVQPVSVGLSGDILTVVNKHEDPAQVSDMTLPNYTAFKVEANGQLRWLAHSTIQVPQGSSPSQALVATGTPFIFGANFLGGTLESLRISQDSLRLHSSMMLPTQEFPNDNGKTPHAPLGMAVNRWHHLVYVGLPTVNKIAVYSYDDRGSLHFVRAIADSGSTVCWLKVNKTGTRLYASNTADPSITVYDISENARDPRELQKLKIDSEGGAYQLALSPDGGHLVVLTQRFMATTPQGVGNELHVMAVDSQGLLTSVSKTVLSLAPDTRPQGILIL